MTDDTPVWIVVTITIIGFFSLAALLLIPVYRFLNREEEVSKEWTNATHPGKRTKEDEKNGENGSNEDDSDGSVLV